MSKRHRSPQARGRAHSLAKSATARMGLHVRPYTDGVQGLDALRDLTRLLQDVSSPTILDVGANEGQSAVRFARVWPSARIHSFEPSPTTFRILQDNAVKLAPTTVVPVLAGVGAAPARGVLLENDQSDMSSFLPPAEESWGDTTAETPIDIVTLDDYCASTSIERVDLLKTDTQGYDFEVLKGADRLLTQGAVRLVYMEMIFSDLYADIPRFDDVYRFMTERRFHLVGMYDQFHAADGRLSFCDLIFIHQSATTARPR